MPPPPATPAIAPHGPGAHAPNLTATLREYLVHYRGVLDARVARGDSGISVGRDYSRAIDGLLSALLPATQATLSGNKKWVDCTLAGVGTYGRGTLAPRSDVDVRIVVDGQTASAQEVAEALLYPLWDAGCHVGHQVIDVEGALVLARDDLATATSLLDLRTVAGPRARVDRLTHRAFEGLFTAELDRFVDRLREERTARHDRFGGSLYLLEPDVKSGAGGLRDLDLARWAARARYRVRELDELVRIGVLLPRELELIVAAQSFLWDVRARLHLRADRRSDRLTFDSQEELGRSLGGASPHDPDHISAERFMQRYYGHARTVSRLVERVFDLCKPPRPRARGSNQEQVIAPGVRTFDGHVTLEQPAQLYNFPSLAMRLYHAAARRDQPVYPYARDAVARAVADPDWCEALRASPEASTLFLECLASAADRLLPSPSGPRQGGSILREMHDVGLLLSMVPEFDPVVGRVHHDIYHVYTVDVHSVAAVDRLRALVRGDLASEYPLACHLAGDVTRPLALYVATLLHDVGKGGGGAGHSERGAELSKVICARLGLAADEIDLVQWLIAEHLTMYHLATRRDLDDPATVASFAGGIVASGGSPLERLRQLYLLTVADISTTSPTAMTSWKARMLDDLFLATRHHLGSSSRGEETPDALLSRIRSETIALASHATHGSTTDRDALAAYLDSMPKTYFLSHTAEEVLAHAAVVNRRGRAIATAGVVPTRTGGAIEVCVAASDRPGLLASVAAALAANRLDIMTAHIFSRPLRAFDEGAGGEDGAGTKKESRDSTSKAEAVDFFCVRRAARDGDEAIEPLTERELLRICNDIRGLVEGGVDPLVLLRERRGGATFRERPSPAVPTGVEIDDRASRRYTVIDVYAKDRPGLLFTIARALHELRLTIARSKIATEGARAADSFYVTEMDGSKVSTLTRRDEIKREVGAAIDRLAREGIAS
ncbi:MAG: [protein-PII] uridylyltransferase [Polyangiales bacterium]